MQESRFCEATDDCNYCDPDQVWHELPFHNSRRRASLEEGRPLKKTTSEKCGRRFSIGNVNAASQFCSRRSSLGEEVLRLNFLRKKLSNSITSLGTFCRRPSLDSDESCYDPRRRSSLGAESLIESDVEDVPDTDNQGEPPPEAVLGLQYVDDVFAVKRELELCYHPRNCLTAQPQVSAPLRCTLVNWLVKVNRQLQFGSETVFLAVNLLDRFLACSAIASDCARLLAICSLIVAAKMEESKVPSIGGLSVLCSSSYQRHHFRRMEILLLTKLGFALHAPSSWYFINYLALKACQLGYLDRTVCRLARRVAETCLCRYDIAQFLPSIQAAAALLYAVTTINPHESLQLQPALLQDGTWTRQSSDASHSGEHCNSSPEHDEQQIFGVPLEAHDYTSEFGSYVVTEHLQEGTSPADNAYYASSLQRSVFEEIMYHKESKSETTSKAVMELVNVLMILFSFHERCEIVHCSDLMKRHTASYDEQRASLTSIVEDGVTFAELRTATPNCGPAITADILLSVSSDRPNLEATMRDSTNYSRCIGEVGQKALLESFDAETLHFTDEINIPTKSALTTTTVTSSISKRSCRIGERYLPVSGIIANVRATVLDIDNCVKWSTQSCEVNWCPDLPEFNQSRRDSGISTTEYESVVSAQLSIKCGTNTCTNNRTE